MKTYRRCNWVAAGVFLAVVYSSQSHGSDASPVRVKNTLPIMHGSGLGAPKPASLMDKLGWSVELNANVQSHANDAAAADEVLILDGEVQSISALLLWKFRPRWQAALELTGIKNTGGQFDSAIDKWHDVFSLDNGDRDLFAQDELRFEYRSAGQTQSLLVDQTSGVSDIELGLAFQAIKNDQVDLSINADISLGTGSEADWLGSGDADVRFSLALASAQRASFSWHANAGVLLTGDQRLFGAETKSSVGFTSLGLHYRVSDNWRWTAQLDGHQAVFKSAIPELSKSAWQLALALEFAKRWQLYFTEDLSVNRAADFTLGLSYKIREF